MKWLEQLKDMLDKNPDISDPELYRAFGELKNDPKRLDAALMYWKYGVVAEEFKRVSWFKRILKIFGDGFRRSFRAA